MLEGFITSGLATYEQCKPEESKKAGEDCNHIGKVEITRLSLPLACMGGEGTRGACDPSNLDHWLSPGSARRLWELFQTEASADACEVSVQLEG